MQPVYPKESILWQSRPSLLYKWPLHLFLLLVSCSWLLLPSDLLLFQVHNFPVVKVFIYVSMGVIAFLLYSLLFIVTVKYQFSNQRIFVYSGILSRTRQEMELYRIKDYKIFSPFYLRIFFLSNVIVFTSDHSTPIFTIYAISNGENITNRLRLFVEINRKEKNVRHFDR